MKREAETVDIKKLLELEEELICIKKENGLCTENSRFVKTVDRLLERFPSKKISVNRRRYLKLALLTGFVGGHRYYSGQYITAVLSTLFFFTGIPFASSLINCMTAFPMQADADGNIILKN